jgi:UMF1 family MFS transporter
VDKVSGLGFALGYLGGGLLFAFNVAMTLKPELFGLESSVTAVKISFLTVSVWWAVFTIPLILRVEEPVGEKISISQAAREGFLQVVHTFAEIRKVKHAFIFLLAYWFYIDGVDTVITMAVDYGKAIGLETSDLIVAILMVQFVGFPFAYAFGWLGQKFGAKRFIFIGLAVYIFVTILGFNLDKGSYDIFGFKVSKFFTMAFLVGTVQGGVQALSRSLFSRLIPRERSAEFFGFYNMVGKFAAIIGPIMMGSVGRITGNPRLGILSIAILFIAGAFLLSRVPRMRNNESEI